jgi:hypothetical protein
MVAILAVTYVITTLCALAHSVRSASLSSLVTFLPADQAKVHRDGCSSQRSRGDVKIGPVVKAFAIFGDVLGILRYMGHKYVYTV